MATRLDDLKTLIERKGLHRERVQDDLVWRWEHFPGYDWTIEWESAQ